MEVKAGVVGGTLLVILLQMNVSQLVNTGILAAVGAVVSFSVSCLMKALVKRFRK